jgi:hypothetical protein
MSITNGKRKNGKGQTPLAAKDLSLVDTIPQESPATEQAESITDTNIGINADISTDAAVASSASDTNKTTPTPPPTEPAFTEENPEDLLRAARSASESADTHDTSSSPVTDDTAATEEQKGDIAPRTTSAAISEATAQVAQNLVQANQQAAQERLQGGLQEGYLDAKEFRQGWQIGFMRGVTEAKQKDSAEFLTQLGLLRQHTDVQTGQQIDELLGKMGISTSQQPQNGEQTQEETALDMFSRVVAPNLPTDNETLNILNLATPPLDPTQQASSQG